MIEVKNQGGYSLSLDMPIDAVIYLMHQAKTASYYANYNWNENSLIHYVIAHYKGEFISDTFVPSYPLQES